MTWLIKHGKNDFRIHANDGTEPLSTSWDSRPSVNEIASKVANDATDGSVLANETLRSVFVDAVSGGISYRDLTIQTESIPWDTE